MTAVGGAKLDFRNARKLLANHIGVLPRIGAEFVKINLLVEVGVFGRTLSPLRIPRVIEAGTVSFPVDAAARSGEIDARHNVCQFPAGGNFENLGVAVFRAILRDGSGDVFAI
jgi:hypothetical protein